MKQLTDLLNAWNTATNQDVRPRAVERILYELSRSDYSPADVAAVVDHLRRQNAKMQGAQFRLNIFNVLGDIEKFESLRAEAAAFTRNRRPPPTPRETVVAQARPVVDPEEARARVGAQFSTLKEILKKAVE